MLSILRAPTHIEQGTCKPNYIIYLFQPTWPAFLHVEKAIKHPECREFYIDEYQRHCIAALHMFNSLNLRMLIGFLVKCAPSSKHGNDVGNSLPQKVLPLFHVTYFVDV